MRNNINTEMKEFVYSTASMDLIFVNFTYLLIVASFLNQNLDIQTLPS